MSHTLVIDIARQAIVLALTLAGPLMAIALGIGLAVSVAQAVTSIQEQTLTFVPKMLAVGAAFLAALPWMIQQMVKFTTELFRSIPSMVQ